MKITKIFKKIRLSKAGYPYVEVLIKTDKHGDNWVKGFGNETTRKWMVGTEIPDDIIKVENYNGKNYYKFEVEGERLNLYNAPATIGIVIDLLKDCGCIKPEEKPAVPENKEDKEEEIDPDDIPF